MFLFIIVIIIQIWKKEGRGGGGGLWRKRQGEYWRAGKPPLGQHLTAPPRIQPIRRALPTLLRGTKGGPGCQQADFIWTLPHWDRNNRHSGLWGRELALYSLYLLYYLMLKKSVCEGRELSRYRTSEAQFTCLQAQASP